MSSYVIYVTCTWNYVLIHEMTILSPNFGFECFSPCLVWAWAWGWTYQKFICAWNASKFIGRKKSDCGIDETWNSGWTWGFFYGAKACGAEAASSSIGALYGSCALFVVEYSFVYKRRQLVKFTYMINNDRNTTYIH